MTPRTAIERIRNRGLVALCLGLAVVILFAGLTASRPGTAEMARTKSPKGAYVYFITPENGATVSSPVTVRFGLEGMGVAPAGVDTPNTGHHHLIIDADLPPMNLPVPKDDHHRHFGGGQTEMSLELPPGVHTLQLLLADQNHVPHDPPVVSERIEVTVR